MGLNPKLPGGEGIRDEGMVSISSPGKHRNAKGAKAAVRLQPKGTRAGMPSHRWGIMSVISPVLTGGQSPQVTGTERGNSVQHHKVVSS
ncbi:hypothetical protein DL886_20525 [Salmonella enterica subsp. enterica serovar Infantis]|uniref:Uncharacterized protein n=6 Tax=Salmonella enterica TaxID=28901 RepID=A0A600TPA6_SALTM|nr:hypothetical protein DXF95_25245 [Salmonella enterica subsp. enterica serovar Heidelberg]EAA0433676.1 hypothetical protein [Salmonella enterica]EAA2741382.1 hypothetical protein [Salmonella enterica subsp. enterica serovar Infantis]EAA9905189.1 hypothetical protein [Salmonella enterica subsp. enterica]EAB0153103.1 hypothetical protein [Salmonella enterica subsp. enterica serovar Typhimurium]EAB5942412.1 hypothetical protein [Salmonella enterica subsp. enterica serovar Minnesota]EAC2063982.